MPAMQGKKGRDRRSGIDEELEALGEQAGSLTAELEDFADWYDELRRQYGRPSDTARAALGDGDFDAFEKLVRDGR